MLGQGRSARRERGQPLQLIAVADRKAVLVRLPPELHDELRRWADDELRSFNAQLEFLLREAVKAHRGKDPGEPRR